jgi:hypothetical protein
MIFRLSGNDTSGFDFWRTIARIGTFLVIMSITSLSVQAYPDTPLTLVVKDVHTGTYLDGAMVFLDGAFLGTTGRPDTAGTLQVHNVSPGVHTVRITQEGYREVTKKVQVPDTTTVELAMNKGFLLLLNEYGYFPHGINVIFIPSETSFSCSENRKLSDPAYTADEVRFKEDVLALINRTFLHLDTITSPSAPLREHYQDRFNFYLYYDPAVHADAFSGCAGTVSDSYWKNVPFGDLTVILYPTYTGRYTGSPCQPMACYKSAGPGRNLMKAPADSTYLFDHEVGHALFGLVDTYCGNTYYYQNRLYPNVWTSPDKCTADAKVNNLDPKYCKQIEGGFSGPCHKQFWRWDPDPDIMETGYYGSFGSAATQRINYILSQSGSAS